MGTSKLDNNFDWTNYITQLTEFPPFVQLWEQELIEELKRWIPRKNNLKVLEIGCSNGRWLRWFKQEYGAQIFGVDLNRIQASMVSNFVLANALVLPIKEGMFDVVFSMGLVEHFGNPRARQKVISEHVRVAKPKTGIVWLEHPNMNFSLDLIYIKYFYDYRQGYRHYYVTDRETKRQFRSLQVDILKTRFIGWIPPRIIRILITKLQRYFPRLFKETKVFLKHKLFEHSLTADNFLIIGRRT